MPVSLTPTVPQNYKQTSVLIVDDNPDHWTIMQSAFGQCLPNARYTWATGPDGTLAYLDECVAEQRSLPRLILLDLYLPRREDGRRLLRQIKQHPRYHQTPVVVISHSDDARDVRDSYQDGGNAYMVKPVDLDGWQESFRRLKTYWWDAVTLPKG